MTKTYGTAGAEQRKTMSGLEFVKGLTNGELPLNTFAKTLGYDVVDAENGRVVITLEPTGAHLNPWGTVHGGLTATLLDSCMGLAIQSTLEKGIGVQHLSLRYRSSAPSRQTQAKLEPKAKSSIAAIASARQKAASPTPKADYSRMARRPA